MSQTTATLWDVDRSLWPCDVNAIDTAIVDQAQAAAQTYLWALSGRRVGTFTTIDELYEVTSAAGCVVPYKDSNGDWRNGGLSDCCRILLRRQPAWRVDEVTVDGVILDPSEYVLTGGTLRRLGACFPSTVDSCEAPRISIGYSWGIAPDPAAELALGAMACDLLAPFNGDVCRMPQGSFVASRQGVTVEKVDTLQLQNDGLTGIDQVDYWVRLVNPNRLPQRSRVVSIDSARRVG